MDIKQLQSDIKAMEERIASMKKELESKQSKVWKPQHGDTAYILWSDGVDFQITYYKRDNEGQLSMGNVFKTKQEAEKARDRRLATVRVVNALREHEGDWIADWNNNKYDKYHVYSIFPHGELILNRSNRLLLVPIEWYSSKEAWQWVIDNMADDVKLMLGVE